MSFDFGGTFSASQFSRLRDYARAQLTHIDEQIAHLKAERMRIGNLAFAFDAGGVPTHAAWDPPLTYCGKLFGAYEALGGDAEYDLQVRSGSQPVFRIAGDVTRPAEMMSNGEVINTTGLGDAQTAIPVQRMKALVAGDLFRRREYLERKIRRALDYAEQLDAEIARLTAMKAADGSEESLEFYVKYVEDLIADKNYLPATDDSSQPDPHGKFARAPIAPYTPGPKGTAASGYQRTTEGFVKPSQ